MPFYEVTTKGEEAKRLVKAPSAAAAIKHCSDGKFTTRTISTVDDAAPLFEAGVKLERVGEEQVGQDGSAPPDDDASKRSK